MYVFVLLLKDEIGTKFLVRSALNLPRQLHLFILNSFPSDTGLFFQILIVLSAVYALAKIVDLKCYDLIPLISVKSLHYSRNSFNSGKPFTDD